MLVNLLKTGRIKKRGGGVCGGQRFVLVNLLETGRIKKRGGGVGGKDLC